MSGQTYLETHHSMTTQRKDSSIDLRRRAEKLKSDTSAQLDKLLRDSVLFQYKTLDISTTGLSLSRSNGLMIHIETGDSYKIAVDNSLSYIELDRMSNEKSLFSDIGRLLSDTILIGKIKKVMDKFIAESKKLDEEIAQVEQNIAKLCDLYAMKLMVTQQHGARETVALKAAERSSSKSRHGVPRTRTAARSIASGKPAYPGIPFSSGGTPQIANSGVFSRFYVAKKVYLVIRHVKTRISADFAKITAKKKPAVSIPAGFPCFLGAYLLKLY